MTTLAERLDREIRDVADFPRPGILFKDITPVLSNPQLFSDVARALTDSVSDSGIDLVAGIESRGSCSLRRSRFCSEPVSYRCASPASCLT